MESISNANMTIKLQRNLALISCAGLAWWLFGNLYEAIVFSPNWVVDSPAQLKRLNDFYVHTSPVIYFVPVTQLATVLVWILFFVHKTTAVKPDLKKASVFALLATGLNVFIVSTIVLKLFGTDYAAYGDYLSTLTWRWNFLNGVRILLVGTTFYFLFNAYRKMDRLLV